MEKTIKKQEIYRGKVIDLYLHDVLIGNEVHKREIVEHRGAVCAVPITKDGNIILIKQFRKAVEDFLIEIPAGKLEIGEKPEESVIREIREEIGYSVRSIINKSEFFTSPGFANEKIYLYFAYLGEKGDTDFDEGENIESLECTLEETLKMVFEGKIQDSKTITGILLYNEFLRRQK